MGAAIAAVLMALAAIVFFFNDRADPSRPISERAGMVDHESGVYGKHSRDMSVPAPDAFIFTRSELTDSANLNTGIDAGRLIVKTGVFSMVVDDVGGAVEMISDYVEQKSGFVVSSNLHRSGLSPYATVVVRLPAADFDQGVDEFKKMGEVTSERVEGMDVTEEYVDLQARLDNFRAAEQRFVEIMRQAEEIEDILAVQRELTQVREQIERIQGRIKYLKQSADLSTVRVNLSNDPESLPVVDDEDKWRPLGEAKESLRGLLNLAKILSYLLIRLVIYLPLWIVLILMAWLGYGLYKRYQRKIHN